MDPVQKQASVQESSGALLTNASELTCIGCGSDPACLLGPWIHFRLRYAKWSFATCGSVVGSNSQHVAYPHIFFYPAGPKHVTKPFDAFQLPILLCDKLAAFGISSDFSPVVKIHTMQSLERVLFLPMESKVVTNQRRGEKADWQKAKQNAWLFNLNVFCTFVCCCTNSTAVLMHALVLCNFSSEFLL